MAVGCNFLWQVVSRRPETHWINLDALTYAGRLENTADFAEADDYSFVQGSISEVSLVEDPISEGVDAVVNFAVESHVDRSIAGPEVFVATNVMGTQNLLETARRHGVQSFLQVSTDRAYYETYGMPVMITRCSNNYGPYQYPEKRIPLFIRRALADEPLPLYGDGLNVRDWLHVEDHCRAVLEVLERGEPGAIYNVGGSNERTNREITSIILDYLDKPETLVSYVTDRLGHDRRYAIDSSRPSQRAGLEAATYLRGGTAPDHRLVPEQPGMGLPRQRRGGRIKH